MIEDISKSLNTATMIPLDAKSLVQTKADLIDLGTDNYKAFTYYDGLKIYCIEDRIVYEWKEVTYGETGLIPSGFPYPPNTIVEEIDYSGKTYNFVPAGEAFSGSVMAYLEPSVNLEFKEEETPIEAMYFGTNDIGGGVEDVALVNSAFVSQSNFELLDGINIGAEIKIYNQTNNTYIGHFVITATVWSSFRKLDIIEKGTWTPLGDYNVQELLITVLQESPYSIELLGGDDIVLKKGTTVINTIDLGPLLSITGATITGGTLDSGTGIVTFTTNEPGSFDVDLSALLVADTVVNRDSLLSPNGATVYENLFVTKTMNAFFGQGFYSADLTTNYNTGNFASFPYPSARDYIICKYLNYYYLLIRKDVTGNRMFNEPNNVLGFSFFEFNDNAEKSMQKISYFKILTTKHALVGLNVEWNAFPITNEVGTNFPLVESDTPFDEVGLIEGNWPNAYPLITMLYKEALPLKKQVTAPYTIIEEDNGRILHIGGTGIITVPQLSYGFECGFVQSSIDVNSISIVAGSGVSIDKPSTKEHILLGQWHSAYLHSNQEHSFNGLIGTAKAENFVLLGDLKDI